jgi:hypothetical protein
MNEFGIQIRAAIPLDRVERNSNALKLGHVPEPSENPEIQIGLHVENALLAVVKSNDKGKAFFGTDFDDRGIHFLAPSTERLNFEGILAVHVDHKIVLASNLDHVKPDDTLITVSLAV